MLPDADIIGFAFGIRYTDMLGHRGLSHSVPFAVVVGCLVAGLAFRDLSDRFNRLALSFYFSVVTASHALLDALTDGGLGVALFAPFSAERYFLPWQPIKVSPIGMAFFSSRGVAVLASEIKWVWLPSLLMIVIAWLHRRIAAEKVKEQ